MNLPFFSDPSNLKKLGHRRIARLFQDFADDLNAASVSLPDPGPESDDYFITIAALIASPAFPERIRIGLSMLELLAAPENVERLDAEIARWLPCVSFDRTSPAVDRAMELWFSARAAALRLADQIQAASPARDDATHSPSAVNSPPSPTPTSESSSSPTGPSLGETPIQTQNSKLENPVRFSRLSDPSVISRVGIHHLHALFKTFAKQLAAKNITSLERIPDTAACADAYAKLLSAPERLPQPLVDALLAIEEFASPGNKQLLEKLAASSGLDDSREPEGWAIRLWLRAPFDLQYIKTLQAHVPNNFYDNDIEYCDPDEDPSSSSSSAPATTADELPKPPIVEINPCPRNKIARLPIEVRDSINRMLGQGLTYAEILRQLGDNAQGLNKSSLSRWKRGPYQIWLKHQQRLEEAGGQLKFALEAVRQNQNNQIHEATQQITALRISELFTQLDLSTLKAAVIEDPATLVRLAHLLPKLSQAGLQCERQRLELSQSKPPASPQMSKGPIKRGLSNKALRYVEQRLHLM